MLIIPLTNPKGVSRVSSISADLHYFTTKCTILVQTAQNTEHFTTAGKLFQCRTLVWIYSMSLSSLMHGSPYGKREAESRRRKVGKDGQVHGRRDGASETEGRKQGSRINEA